jgi:hypothetical protein
MINNDYFQNSVNRSISILENHHACCNVGTESLNANKMNLILDFHPKNKLERDQSQINMHFQKTEETARHCVFECWAAGYKLVSPRPANTIKVFCGLN